MIKLKNIPNLLTFSRLLLFPLWLLIFYLDYYYFLLIIIIYSALSDYFDGFLARKLSNRGLGLFSYILIRLFTYSHIHLITYSRKRKKVRIHFPQLRESGRAEHRAGRLFNSKATTVGSMS